MAVRLFPMGRNRRRAPQPRRREAEDRQWPDAETWEDGPDVLRFPGLYDPVEPVEDNEDDDLEPLDLDSSQAARTS